MTKYYSIFFLFSMVLLSVQITLAQENQGLVFDNYNPVNSQFMNPTSIVDAKPWLDINIIGASSFVSNNYFFYPNTTLFNYKTFENEPQQNENVAKIKGNVNVWVMGPSASLVVGRQSFSIYSTARTMGNATNIPAVLGKMTTEDGLSESDTGFYDVSNARAKTMSWGEIGFTYGGIVKARETNMIIAAVSLKRLFGFQNSTININDGLLYVVTPDSSVMISNNGKYSYADPATNAGRGWGISIGATFKKMKENVSHYIPHSTKSNCKNIDYRYKIGVSLIDIGYINFRNDAYRGNLEDVTFIDTLETGDNALNEIKRLATDTKFTAPLPMAISIQADYNINDLFYLNATLVQRFPQKNTFAVERTNLVSFSGRYESKYIGIGIPVSVINYEKVLVGFALRLANLSIGTDHLLPWIVKQDINTASLYFNLKFTLYKSPPCRIKKNKNKKENYLLNACPVWK